MENQQAEQVSIFDVKVLIEKLKGKGLSEAEKLLHTVAGETFDWAQESLSKSSNKFLIMGAAVMPLLKTGALNLIEQIDGKAGVVQ